MTNDCKHARTIAIHGLIGKPDAFGIYCVRCKRIVREMTAQEILDRGLGKVKPDAKS